MGVYDMSKNGLDLISISGSKLNGKKGKAFLGTLFYLLPTLGICAVPYVGWAIGIILFGFITPGYINFIQKLMNNENPKYEIIFRGKGDILASIFLGIILAGGMILGSVLAIVPGMFFAVYYSMSFFFLNEEEITNTFDSMKKCAKNVVGNATNLFAYKSIFYIYYVIIALVCVALGLAVWGLVKIIWLAVILYVIIAIAFILLVSLCTMFLYAANCVFYEEVIAYQEVKKTRRKAKKMTIEKESEETVVTEPAVAMEEKKEEVKVEKPVEKKTESKPATTKPATAKTSTAKTSTAKSSSAKKPAATKTSSKAPAKKGAVKK